MTSTTTTPPPGQANTTMQPAKKLDTLEPEVLAHILSYLQDSSPHSFGNAAVSCQYLFAVARDLVANHHKFIDLDECTTFKNFTELTAKIDAWAEDGAVRRNMRILTVKGESKWMEGSVTNNETPIDMLDPNIMKLLSKAGNVQLLIWRTRGSPSEQLLKTLHLHHASANLRVLDFDWENVASNGTEATPRLEALANSPALTQLRCQIHQTASQISICVLGFRYVVSRAPNLVRASLQNHHGGHISRHQREVLNKLLPPGPKPNSSLRELTLDGYDMAKSTLQDWAKLVDLSKLENVRFFRGLVQESYFVSAPTLLPSLAHFSMNLRNSQYRSQNFVALQEYLKACAPLKTLSLWSWGDCVVLEPILARHGPTLTNLGLHDRESRSDYAEDQRNVLSTEEVKDLLEKCPNLETLTIDLQRHSDQPAIDGTDDNTTSFKLIGDSKIDKLEIYFDAGIAYSPELMRRLAVRNANVVDYASDDEDDDMEDDSDGSDEDDEEDEEEDEEDVDNVAAQDIGENADTAVAKAPPTISSISPEGTWRPSSEEALEAYVEYIWTTVFGSRVNGECSLIVKFGEWETYHNFATRPGNGPMDTVWMFHAKEHERDDLRGVPKIHKQSFQGYGLG